MPIITKPIPTDNPSGALIGFNNLLVSASSFGTEVMLTPNTYERFVSGGVIEARFAMLALTNINFVGIAAHTLAGQTITIQTAQTVDGSLTDLIRFTVPDNSPIMLTFDTVNVREIALVSSLVGIVEIGVIYAGTTLQMPRNIYGGHSPITLSPKTEYQSSESESGQFIGENIIRKGLQTSFDWQFLDDEFIRGEFKDFVESARTKPFFIKWRPDFYFEEVAYCKVREDITPVNMGGGIRSMRVGFNAKAHADL